MKFLFLSVAMLATMSAVGFGQQTITLVNPVQRITTAANGVISERGTVGIGGMHGAYTDEDPKNLWDFGSIFSWSMGSKSSTLGSGNSLGSDAFGFSELLQISGTSGQEFMRHQDWLRVDSDFDVLHEKPDGGDPEETGQATADSVGYLAANLRSTGTCEVKIGCRFVLDNPRNLNAKTNPRVEETGEFSQTKRFELDGGWYVEAHTELVDDPDAGPNDYDSDTMIWVVEIYGHESPNEQWIPVQERFVYPLWNDPTEGPKTFTYPLWVQVTDDPGEFGENGLLELLNNKGGWYGGQNTTQGEALVALPDDDYDTGDKTNLTFAGMSFVYLGQSN